jgi:hypothetical protein
MAHWLLSGEMPHVVEYEVSFLVVYVTKSEEYVQLSSIFYVFYLFALSVDQPFPSQEYPWHVPLPGRAWPAPVALWTHLNRRALNLSDLAEKKHTFFSKDKQVFSVFYRQENNNQKQHIWNVEAGSILQYLYDCIWPKRGQKRDEIWEGGLDIAPLLIDVLRNPSKAPLAYGRK